MSSVLRILGTAKGDIEEHGVKLLLPVPTIDHALDSIPQVSDVEVNQQTNSDTAQPHVREKLRLMDGMNCIDALYFDDNHILDDQINPVPKLNLLSVEKHRQADLAGHREAALPDLMGKTALIRAFQQSWPQRRMNMHGTRHDGARNLVNPK